MLDVTPSVPSSAQRPANLLALSPEAIRRRVQDLGWPTYRAAQILRWLYRHRVRDIRQMTNLSESERSTLSAGACIRHLDQGESFTSADGTQKFLARLEDGLPIECVLIPDDGRLTLCVSTQVGCTLDCGFCLTATMGLKRNLKAHEIVDQVLMVQSSLPRGMRLTNLVFMGMGEPLANWEAVADAVGRLTNDQWGVGFSPRRMTVSTAGLAPRLQDAQALGVNLAISLNATTDALRNRLMPAINHLYPLRRLLSACRQLRLKPRERLTFEYVLLAGVNDAEEDAGRLGHLLTGMRCKVNLIPFNEFPGSPFQRPTDAAVEAFQSIVRGAGLDVFVRKSKGRDVLGACGQLGDLPSVTQPAVLTPAGACS